METKNLKPFDLERAKAGDKIVHSNRSTGRLICGDLKGYTPLVFAWEGVSNEYITQHSLETAQSRFFMAPKTTTYWVNILNYGGIPIASSTLFRTKEEAERFNTGYTISKIIATFPIEITE